MRHNKETENLALLYAYGELGQELETDFLPHLKECKECQEIVRLSSFITAALPEKKAPAHLLPQAKPVKPIQAPRRSLWDIISPAFSFKRIVPAGAMMLILTFIGITAYKYGTVNNNYDFVDNIYAEISNIETELDDIFSDFEDL
jgi:hypothetical protein